MPEIQPHPHTGGGNPNAKLLPSEVRSIRESYKAGAKTRDLAEKHEVSHSTIIKIAGRRSWISIT